MEKNYRQQYNNRQLTKKKSETTEHIQVTYFMKIHCNSSLFSLAVSSTFLFMCKEYELMTYCKNSKWIGICFFKLFLLALQIVVFFECVSFAEWRSNRNEGKIMSLELVNIIYICNCQSYKLFNLLQCIGVVQSEYINENS